MFIGVGKIRRRVMLNYMAANHVPKDVYVSKYVCVREYVFMLVRYVFTFLCTCVCVCVNA